MNKLSQKQQVQVKKSIVLLGDQTLFNQEINNDFSKSLQQQLEEKFFDYQIINLTVDGLRVSEMLKGKKTISSPQSQFGQQPQSNKSEQFIKPLKHLKNLLVNNNLSIEQIIISIGGNDVNYAFQHQDEICQTINEMNKQNLYEQIFQDLLKYTQKIVIVIKQLPLRQQVNKETSYPDIYTSLYSISNENRENSVQSSRDNIQADYKLVEQLSNRFYHNLFQIAQNNHLPIVDLRRSFIQLSEDSSNSESLYISQFEHSHKGCNLISDLLTYTIQQHKYQCSQLYYFNQSTQKIMNTENLLLDSNISSNTQMLSQSGCQVKTNSHKYSEDSIICLQHKYPQGEGGGYASRKQSSVKGQTNFFAESCDNLGEENLLQGVSDDGSSCLAYQQEMQQQIGVQEDNAYHQSSEKHYKKYSMNSECKKNNQKSKGDISEESEEDASDQHDMSESGEEREKAIEEQGKNVQSSQESISVDKQQQQHMKRKNQSKQHELLMENMLDYNHIRKVHYDVRIKDLERYQFSYVKHSDGETYSQQTALVQETINREWIGVPVKQHDQFPQRDKNIYHSLLFQIEDERYDISFETIQMRQFRKSLKRLKQLLKSRREIEIAIKKLEKHINGQNIFNQYNILGDVYDEGYLSLIEFQVQKRLDKLAQLQQQMIENQRRRLDENMFYHLSLNQQLQNRFAIERKQLNYIRQLYINDNSQQESLENEQLRKKFTLYSTIFWPNESQVIKTPLMQEALEMYLEQKKKLSLASQGCPQDQIKAPNLILNFNNQKALDFTLNFIWQYISEYGTYDYKKIFKSITETIFGRSIAQIKQQSPFNLCPLNEENYLLIIQQIDKLLKNNQGNNKVISADCNLLLPKLYNNYSIIKLTNMQHQKKENELKDQDSVWSRRDLFLSSSKYLPFIVGSKYLIFIFNFIYSMYERFVLLLATIDQYKNVKPNENDSNKESSTCILNAKIGREHIFLDQNIHSEIQSLSISDIILISLLDHATYHLNNSQMMFLASLIFGSHSIMFTNFSYLITNIYKSIQELRTHQFSSLMLSLWERSLLQPETPEFQQQQQQQSKQQLQQKFANYVNILQNKTQIIYEQLQKEKSTGSINSAQLYYINYDSQCQMSFIYQFDLDQLLTINQIEQLQQQMKIKATYSGSSYSSQGISGGDGCANSSNNSSVNKLKRSNERDEEAESEDYIQKKIKL